MNGKPASILVVDDVALNRVMLAGQLRRMGFNVREAVDGVHAVLECRTYHFNLVFMDCHAPSVYGYQATQLIRENEASNGLPRVPIIGVSGDDAESFRERIMASGMDGFITNPLVGETLCNCLSTWLPRISA